MRNMTLTKYNNRLNGFGDFNLFPKFRNDWLFESFFDGDETLKNYVFNEKTGKHSWFIEIPGGNKNNTTITIVSDYQLEVKSKRNIGNKERTFHKRIEMPFKFNDSIEAKFQDGVLELSVQESKPETKQVPIN